MKKYLFAMLGALFVFTACTTGKPENDGNKTTEPDHLRLAAAVCYIVLWSGCRLALASPCRAPDTPGSQP